MKIMMVPSGYYPDCCGGVEVITQALSEGITKKGHEVHVLCQSNKSENTIINGVYVHKMKPKELNNKNNNVFKYKINRLLQMYNPFNKKELKKIIKEINPDIINIHMVRTLSMSVFKVAQELNIPIVSTLHEYFSLWNFNPFDKMEKMLESKPQWYVELIRNKHRKLTKKIDYIIAPLEQTINIYKNEGYYRDVFGEEIVNAMPMFDEEKRLKILQEKKDRVINNNIRKFLIISRLMPFKGVELAIESFMKTKDSNMILNIVGDGPLASYVKKCAKLDKRIIYHGYLIGDEKDKIFRESDVLVFPTTELETFGLVILEAYNYCMPIISSSVSATRRLIKNNKTGYVINDINEKKIINHFRKYNNNDILIKQIENCYNEIKADDYDKFIEKYINIYEKILKKVKK